MTLSTSTTSRGDDNFDDFADAVRRRAATFQYQPLFTTRADGVDLFQVFVDGLPSEIQQAHRCNTCKSFLRHYGSLAVVNAAGGLESVFFGGPVADVPAEYSGAYRELGEVIRSSKVHRVFLSADPVWGHGVTGTWHHFSVPALSRFKNPLKTAGQMMAEKAEDYAMLQRGLAEFPHELVAKAVAILETDTFYRSEKVLGAAQWLLKLHESREAAVSQRSRDHLTWLAVATAPPGFCHVRTTMISTLLEDLAAGKSVEEAKRGFADKMHGLRYQRPQAAPSEGNIAQAEGIFSKLKTAGSLERRFARLAEVEAIWKPKEELPKVKTGGVFDHLRQAAQKAEGLAMTSPKVITWEKFAREVLPTAEQIDCLVPRRGSFISLVTAANPDAPPILKWDSEGKRNPFSWYFYVNGAWAEDYNLEADTFVEVKAFALSPTQWGGRDSPNEAKMAIAVLAGARDRTHLVGGGLFVESLKNEYHSVRRTLEAHFAKSKIAGLEEADANGIALQAGSARSPWDVVFRVRAKGVLALYRPDRWD